MVKAKLELAKSMKEVKEAIGMYKTSNDFATEKDR